MVWGFWSLFSLQILKIQLDIVKGNQVPSPSEAKALDWMMALGPFQSQQLCGPVGSAGPQSPDQTPQGSEKKNSPPGGNPLM